jgi:phosphoribosylformylglycinamidine synthase
VALAECAVTSGLGAEIACGSSHKLVELYGEGGGQAVVAARPDSVGAIEALAEETRVPLRRLGSVGGGTLLGVPVAGLRAAYESALPGRLG